MPIVSGKNRSNRPYFFNGVDGERVEFPAMGEGIGELEGAALTEFQALVKIGAIVTGDVTTEQFLEALPNLTAEIEALAETKPDPLDHDGDGRKGGSLPKRGRPKKEV